MNSVLSTFPQDIRCRITADLDSGAVIGAETTAEALTRMRLSLSEFMCHLVPLAAAYARAPISRFDVGAVALGMPDSTMAGGPGNLYLGANMEFPGVGPANSIHAEQAAFNNAWLHGENGLQALATSAAPCGHCRQFLFELTSAKAGFQLYRCREQGPPETTTLSTLLPDAFGPHDLGVKAALMAPAEQEMATDVTGEFAHSALEQARRSYAPYSGNYAGVVLVSKDGRQFPGRYAENAAFNPTLTATASAIAFQNMSRRPQEALSIREAVMVEAASGFSQLPAASALLSTFDPGVSIRHYRAVLPETKGNQAQ